MGKYTECKQLHNQIRFFFFFILFYIFHSRNVRYSTLNDPVKFEVLENLTFSDFLKQVVSNFILKECFHCQWICSIINLGLVSKLNWWKTSKALWATE
jgi:hypothetical protein